MKIYHFLKAEYGLQAIQNQRLKVSFLDNLNDPFELYATKLTDKRLRNKFYSLADFIIDTFGMLCFSRQWRSPLLWSHYADRHKGVALVFEVTDARIKKIKYQQKRIEIDDSMSWFWLMEIEKLQNKLLTTKYSQWSYEDEARIFLSSNEIYKDGGLSFYNFSNDVKLTGIVLGPLCDLNETKIKRVLPSDSNIKLTKSRLAFQTYDVVSNKNYVPRIIKKK